MLTGKTVLVTGASSGIGAELARECSRRGAAVVLVARRAEKLGALAEALPGPALVIAGDVSHPDDRARAITETQAHFGGLHGLINNAGMGGGNTPFADTPPEQIEQVFAVNLLGAMHLTRAALPLLRDSGGGFILNVSSPMGTLNLPGHSLYCISKAGLSSFSQVLRRELRHDPITVTDWLPGFVRSEIITPQQEQSLPRLEPVRDPAEVVPRALDAALRGQASLQTTGWLARLAMFTNRNLPRLVEAVARKTHY